jgi:hypothetical protein
MTLAAAVAVAACGDSTAPIDTEPSFAKGGNAKPTREATMIASTDDEVATAATAESGSPQMLKFAEWAPPLQTYDTTFVTYQGWRENFVIFFEDWVQFMVLEIPNSAQFVDENGQPLPDGARVEITVHVDSTHIFLEFGPHGSSFTGNRPVMLWVWYKYSDLADNPEQLRVWYQPNSSEKWNSLPTEISKSGGWLKAPLYHFSNYAVAWCF